jgi:hypothetical protein
MTLSKFGFQDEGSRQQVNSLSNATVVARATTDSSGNYTLKAPPDDYHELRSARSSGGYVLRYHYVEPDTFHAGTHTRNFILPSLNFEPATCPTDPCTINVVVSGFAPNSPVDIYLAETSDPENTYQYLGSLSTDSAGNGADSFTFGATNGSAVRSVNNGVPTASYFVTGYQYASESDEYFVKAAEPTKVLIGPYGSVGVMESTLARSLPSSDTAGADATTLVGSVVGVAGLALVSRKRRRQDE